MCTDFESLPGADQQTSESPSIYLERILIATPGLEDGHINITRLPDCSRFTTIPTPKGTNTGMVMALGLTSRISTLPSPSSSSKTIYVAAGYESGHIGLWKQSPVSSTANLRHQSQATFHLIYIHHSHTQPILSLCFDPEGTVFYTSSADALIVRHRFTAAGTSQVPPSSSAYSQVQTDSLQTRHAGQQSLAMRSDGKIFATAGWDGRARVYVAGESASDGALAGEVGKVREVAVLRWHQEGCYAVGFAHVKSEEDSTNKSTSLESRGQVDDGVILSVAERRDAAARNAHWLALGSKDGKVSLWDIF
jgi:WD40 repeat protein